MILYNWSTILRVTGGDPNSILEIISLLTYPKIPNNRYDPLYKISQVDWTGESFLLHPEKMLEMRNKVPLVKLAEYVAVASFRSYAHYLATGDRTLEKNLCPASPQLINNNRLLSTVNGKIYFCWEEVTH